MTLITLHELVPDIMADFIHAPLHRVALAHNTFTDDALALTVRSSPLSSKPVCGIPLRSRPRL